MKLKKNNWLTIKEIKFNDCLELLKFYEEKNIHYSIWIKNLVQKYNYKFDKKKLPINLKKVSLKELGFTDFQVLKNVYQKIEDLNYKLVPPEIALYARILLFDQPKGSWIRFATPLDQMIDDDKVPHLPKVGYALNTYFIETYWAYENAIFFPHNEFIVIDNK
jgi:hypothetical protein